MKYRRVEYNLKWVSSNVVICDDKPLPKVYRYYLNNLDWAYESKEEIEASIDNLIEKVMLNCSVSEKEAAILINKY